MENLRDEQLLEVIQDIKFNLTLSLEQKTKHDIRVHVLLADGGVLLLERILVAGASR